MTTKLTFAAVIALGLLPSIPAIGSSKDLRILENSGNLEIVEGHRFYTLYGPDGQSMEIEKTPMPCSSVPKRKRFARVFPEGTQPANSYCSMGDDFYDKKCRLGYLCFDKASGQEITR